MNNFIQTHADKAGMIFLGLVIAGFISDIQWMALARAFGF